MTYRGAMIMLCIALWLIIIGHIANSQPTAERLMCEVPITADYVKCWELTQNDAGQWGEGWSYTDPHTLYQVDDASKPLSNYQCLAIAMNSVTMSTMWACMRRPAI